jgi:dihydrofolate reductase
MISLIAAMAKNRVIGLNGGMPWHMPADLEHFKTKTLEKPIIMGRKTFETLGKALPRRRNIIITRNADYHADGCDVFTSLPEAIAACADVDEIMVVGGAQIYSQALSIVDRMYLTYIDIEVAGDTFFPEWDAALWQESTRDAHQADERHLHNFDFVQLDRK